MFYSYRQSNSGGIFDINHENGVEQFVIVEAPSADVANDIAENIGLYFDGVYRERDCPCCGDRWERCQDGRWSDARDEPMLYSDAVLDGENGSSEYSSEHNVCIHYLDGRKVWATYA